MSERARQPSRRIDAPEPGWFRLRLARAAPPVGARIYTRLGQLVAEINGAEAGVDAVWTSGEAISEAEYRRLIEAPPADPTKAVDYRAMGRAEPGVEVARPNRPVVDLAAALEPEALGAWLEHEMAEHAARCAELGAAYERFLVATAGGIADDTATGRATDFAKMHKAEITAIDATRKRIKEPVLHAQRLIDGAGNGLTTPLRAQALTIENRIATYLTGKAEAARREAEMEAQRLAAAAAEAMRDAEPEEAIVALRDAQAAEALATASTPDLTRTRSATGALAGLRDNFVYEVKDIALVPTHLLQVNDAAVRLFIRQGARHVPGLRIWNDARAFVR
jgi:hypothetical protein